MSENPDLERKHSVVFTPDGSVATFNWIVVGEKGAIHFHIGADTYINRQYSSWSAGLECHYRNPPDYMKEKPCSQKKCWILNAPCWHDGGSLYAEEHVLPILQRCGVDALYLFLEGEYVDRLLDKEES
jgi:hypothetical protein